MQQYILFSQYNEFFPLSLHTRHLKLYLKVTLKPSDFCGTPNMNI